MKRRRLLFGKTGILACLFAESSEVFDIPPLELEVAERQSEVFVHLVMS